MSRDIDNIYSVSELSSSYTVAHTVDATSDPDITVFISSSTIASVKQSGVWCHIRLQIPLVVSIDGSGNGWPWCLEGQHTFDIVSFQFLL